LDDGTVVVCRSYYEYKLNKWQSTRSNAQHARTG
jgi:hypothetical protein